ncbi:MAG: peroxiredoxin family protein [Thermomicrobiales bacterium]
MVTSTEPPIAVVPPFVLPDREGKPFNTARWRGRRYGLLLFLAPDDPDATAYLQSFAARREELAWLHTAVIVVVPTTTNAGTLPALPFPILRDGGAVRARVLPAVAPDVMALIVTDLSGQVTAWRTARRVASLPDVEMALGWAWEVAQPKGSCGGVTWSATAQPASPVSPPAPVGRFTVGVRPHHGYRRHNSGR